MSLTTNAADGRALGPLPAPKLAPAGGGRNLWRALAALRRLLADKEDTAQVFEIMRSMNGPANLKGYARLLSTGQGGRIAYERVELAPKLMDAAFLDSLPAGSVGAAYADFVRRENLSAEGLAVESRKGIAPGLADLPHPHAWYGRRMRDSHDIWHVLTGYGRDALGEACLVAFSYRQTGGMGWLLIALAALLRSPGRACRAAILEGFRRGGAAAWLPGEDYQRLLAEPLDNARRRLGIAPPRAYDAVPAELRDRAARA